MAMTSEKLQEIQERILDVIKEHDNLGLTDIISLFALMLGKTIRVASCWNKELSLGLFHKVAHGIENMLANPVYAPELMDIINMLQKIDSEQKDSDNNKN